MLLTYSLQFTVNSLDFVSSVLYGHVFCITDVVLRVDDASSEDRNSTHGYSKVQLLL